MLPQAPKCRDERTGRKRDALHHAQAVMTTTPATWAVPAAQIPLDVLTGAAYGWIPIAIVPARTFRFQYRGRRFPRAIVQRLL
jgi:hypothetical protein